PPKRARLVRPAMRNCRWRAPRSCRSFFVGCFCRVGPLGHLLADEIFFLGILAQLEEFRVCFACRSILSKFLVRRTQFQESFRRTWIPPGGFQLALYRSTVVGLL